MATLRQPQTPGIDIGERRMTSADARLFARDPGPGNPRVGPGGSPEARAFQPPPRPASVAGMDAVERPMSSAEARQFRVPGTPTVSPAQRAGQALRETYQTAVGREVGQGPQRPMSMASRALRFGGTALGAGGAAIGSLVEDVPKVAAKFDDPNATGIGKTAAVAGAGGKAAATVAGTLSGAKLGAAAGTAVLPGVGTFVGGLLGSGVGGYLANRAAGAVVDPALGPSTLRTSPAGGAKSPTPLGMTGAGTDAKKLVGDFDRSPSQDLTAPLNNVDSKMPNGMARGMIYKTMDANGRPVYSGFDVGNDAQMVDGKGQQLRSGGTLSVVGGMAPGEAQTILARPMPGQGQGGPVNLTAQGGLFDTPRARRQAEALRLEQRGQDLNFSATTRGQDMSLKGVMATVGERRAARMQELAVQQALRGRQAAYVQGAKGNLAQAAEDALANGDTAIAEALGGAADKGDARALKRREAVKDILKPMAVTKDKDGNPVVNDALVESATADLEGVAGALGLDSVDQLLTDANRARAAVKLINGLNQRNQTLSDFIGLTEPTRRRQLPSLRGAQSETVGIADGAIGVGREMGDRRFVTGSGNLYLPQEIYADEGVQSLLAELTKQK